ncbi:hypothetical protein SUGI_0626550 [Cryptomeria japonica]|uniref:expansin-A11 n=1 Tax=Cryptomeria japonica TaxID=3369 RepID=UPI0024148BF3|nr:expansin-A11 [Cryptomeria japonica]GLJ31247.1 hypothetical protein SUGI_0626550 [Cryptomeria japonica]
MGADMGEKDMARRLMVLTVICYFIKIAEASGGGGSGWSRGHATFYGGSNAAPSTMGGACGYDNVYTAGYGVYTTALSSALFREGEACGACYELLCDSMSDRRWCRQGGRVVVSATNFCPSNDRGGWCNSPLQHFDKSLPAFTRIARYSSGIVPVLFRRVGCAKKGGVKFTVKGHSFFNLVLISNVGGNGVVKGVWVRGGRGGVWQAMHRNWGANWQNNSKLDGKPLSFRVMVEDGKMLTFNNVVPSNWRFGQTFATRLQFS